MIHCLAQLASDHRVEWHHTAEQIARKLCLFYCGCCRLRWDSLAGDEARDAVAVIERHADGRANRFQWQSARQYAAAAERATRRRWGWGNTPEQQNAASLAALVAAAAKARSGLCGGIIRSGCPVEVPTQVALLRDLFDNPFAPTAVNPEWFTTTVVGIARTIYASRSFDSMGVLGDALQDAGCDCPQVLDHCYNPGVHSRGCWLLDAVLWNIR
jgi:hypothetical protein